MGQFQIFHNTPNVVGGDVSPNVGILGGGSFARGYFLRRKPNGYSITEGGMNSGSYTFNMKLHTVTRVQAVYISTTYKI